MNIVIQTNRRQLPIVFIISSLVTILLLVNLIYTKTENMVMDGLFNWIFNSILVLLAIPYMALSFAQFIKTRYDKTAVIKITDLYLYDNLKIFSFGNIPWNDISGVEMVKALRTHLLVIKLTDNKKYLTTQNFIQRYVLKKWIKKWGSPVIISDRQIEYDITLLKDIIQSRVKRAN